MGIDYKVPFYANTPDDTHCFQAGLKSILKYFVSDRDFTWEELDKATAKGKDLWTWPMAGLIWMKSQGFDIQNIEIFDYQKFINIGQAYLVEKYGADVAAAQARNSDVDQEIGYAKKFVSLIKTQEREATLDDIIDYLKKGYLVGVNVNARTLNGEPGYVGHFVLVKGVKDGNLIIHDPGSPPLENRVISFEQFDKGWAYPTVEERNLMAFKK